MTAEQDTKASNMDSPSDTAGTNTASGEVQQEPVEPTPADLDKVHDGKLSTSLRMTPMKNLLMAVLASACS